MGLEGGHRALCKGPAVNRKIHTILRELLTAECKWLKELSPTEKASYFQVPYLDGPLNHLFHAGEVALVLCRANACAA